MNIYGYDNTLKDRKRFLESRKHYSLEEAKDDFMLTQAIEQVPGTTCIYMYTHRMYFLQVYQTGKPFKYFVPGYFKWFAQSIEEAEEILFDLFIQELSQSF